MESLTADGGSWAADTVNSDASNLRIDNVNFQEGGGSFEFDIIVAQSSNNRGTIQNTSMTALDLSRDNGLSSFIFWAYIPVTTNFSSVTFYWGSDTSNYWSEAATTQYDGSAFIAGWNRIKVDWPTASMVGTPDPTNITYMRFDFNYTGSYTNTTGFHIDQLELTRPENLTFFYTSFFVGTDTTGATNKYAFTATTDIPYFSSLYDQYKYAVAHKMASIAFTALRLRNEAADEQSQAAAALLRVQALIPSDKTPEMKSFKVDGIRFRKRYRRVYN